MSSQSSQSSRTAGELAEHTGGTLVGDATRVVDSLDTVDKAGPTSLTFVGDEKWAGSWSDSKAGTVVVNEDIELPSRAEAFTEIRVRNADHAMIVILDLFQDDATPATQGIHPTAVVDPSATISAEASIGPHCRIGAGCAIASGVVLENSVTLKADVTLGEGTLIDSCAVLHRGTRVGRNCILHSNAVIGADGFGYRPSPEGDRLLKIPHLGTVEIGDDVEIGAGTCIDRGKFGATRIGGGTKIDNLCQIGHNCLIGRMCVICGMVGIAGSTEIGNGTRIGGGCGISDHLKIGQGVSIGAGSGVMNDIPDGETWYGVPAGERSRVLREYAAMRKLPEWSKKIKALLSGHEAS
ncbi:MAG: UDP-3-O-(3-hydroxymyristoyl)glucosamine N-acyltransferase [Planctomycetaceae bacterium]|nr:UDP-3-O-(3-hydroxymyristoyl)glucosamine N-acyltransferase [Planctomycetaceae bacterium]|tara:strand:- start:195 stop:1250 length:1056 start_codon:yes stop_codon:yes gene_type:complete